MPRHCSGAMYDSLPLRLPDRVSCRIDADATPKSTTLIEPS
jgi:hypothetical protein